MKEGQPRDVGSGKVELNELGMEISVDWSRKVHVVRCICADMQDVQFLPCGVPAQGRSLVRLSSTKAHVCYCRMRRA